MNTIVKLSVRSVMAIIMAMAGAGALSGQTVETGIEQLVKSDFGILKGKTGRPGDQSDRG